MESVYVRDSNNALSTPKAILELYRLKALQKKHVFVSIFVSIVVLAGLATGLRYSHQQTGDVERLLATRTCENCNLSRTNLAGACLSGSNLRGATLKGADLSVADLSHADLRDADLSGASFFRANLIGADLRGANVTGVHLLFADVSGALWTDGRTCARTQRR